jgi:hypothetical protein
MPNQTGPTSTLGKLTSCMNNFKHGGASESLFLKGENPDEFFALLQNAFEQHQPVFDQEAALVTDLVRARWVLDRRVRVADRLESALFNSKPDGANSLTAADVGGINHFDRYVTQADRRLNRALKGLQLVKKMKRDESLWPLQLELQQIKLAAEAERFNLVCEKAAKAAAQSQPAPPVSETREEVPSEKPATQTAGARCATDNPPVNENIRYRTASSASSYPSTDPAVVPASILMNAQPTNPFLQRTE